MHWFRYVTGIIQEVERNTFVVSVMVIYMAYVGTSGPKY
jgi:hypothetical protein